MLSDITVFFSHNNQSEQYFGLFFSPAEQAQLGDDDPRRAALRPGLRRELRGAGPLRRLLLHLGSVQPNEPRGLELGLGKWRSRAGEGQDLLTRPEARHDTKYFGPCRHDTNTRTVPCVGSRHGGLHGPAHILGLVWAGTAKKIVRRHFYNYTM